MADPLSIAASAAGLLSLGLQTTEYLYKFYTAYRDQHQDLARISDQLSGLLETLQIIAQIVRTRKWRPDEQRIIHNVEEAITRSKTIIDTLQDEVAKFEKEPKDDWRHRVVVVGRRAAYPFKRSTLEDLGDEVETFRDNLSVALQALQLKEHQNTQSDIQLINTIVKDIQAQSINTELRQWLRAPDATIDFNLACAKRHAGTGEWLIQGSAFTTWLQLDNSFLWLYGFAGCGKSVLCSTAIQHAFRHQQSFNGNAVAFFFFTFNDESKQDASAALRAILLQLCGQIPELDVDLARLKDLYKNSTPPVPVLLDFLRQAATRCRHVYLLLDALDESPADTSRPEVLSFIETLRCWRLPGLHLLVTSRDVQDIRDGLQSFRILADREQIALKNDGIQQDISQYVAYQVDHDPKLVRWGDNRGKIKKYLIDNADGVFRWVECQLHPLRSCPQSRKMLDKCLRKLPRDLDQTYERILCQIGDESCEEAQQILSLLCYASRPLTVDEVIEATAVDLDDLESYDPEKRFEGADDLRRICPGLIDISAWSSSDIDEDLERERNNGANMSMDGKWVVRIAHFSVQEYLLSDRIRNSQAATFALSGPVQHARISKACLLYLSCTDFLQQTLDENLVKQYAFAMYAARYWHIHYQQSDSPLTESLSEMAVSFLTAHRTRRRWLALSDPDLGWRTDFNRSGLTEDSPSPIYYTSLLGLEKTLASLLVVSATDIDAKGGTYGCALQAASVSGHEKIVQILLDRGADINAQAGGWAGALQLASVCGHEKIVQILLDRGADFDAQGGRLGNVLNAASVSGHEKIVQILLDRGADVNARGGESVYALQAASVGGHEKIVQMLLDHGADAYAQGRHALQMASECGYEKIVQILLDRGVDVNAQGGANGNALYAASEWGHEKVVQILLDRGADVNARGGEHVYALRAASVKRHEKIVQILLDRGANADALRS